MGKLKGGEALKESYKKFVSKRPFIEEILIIGGTCLFALAVSIAVKTLVKKPVDLDIKLNPNEAAYYSANYDLALKEYAEKGEKEDWPIWTVKEAEIASLKGEVLNSNVKLSSAYRKRNEVLTKEGRAKYKEEDKTLGNYISFTYLLNGEVDKSIEYGEDFLKNDPINDRLRETLIVSYIYNNDINSAKEILRDYGKESRDSYKLSKKSELYFLVKDYESALAALNKAYELDNNNIRILDSIDNGIRISGLDLVNISKNRNDKVSSLLIDRYELLNNIDFKKNIDNLSKRENKSLIEEKMLLEALDYYKEDQTVDRIITDVLNDHSDNYGGCYVLSEYYLKAKNLKKSLEYGKKALELNEDYGNIYANLFPKIITFKDSKNYKLLAPYFRRGIYNDPFNCILIENTANYYINEMQESEVSYKYFELLSKIASKDSKSFYNLAILNEKREEKDLAIKNMEKAIELDKNNTDYLNALGCIYFTFEKGDKGIEYIRKAYNIDNNDITTLNNAAYYYGKYEKNIVRAMENIKKAYELSKDSNDLILKAIVDSNYSEIKSEYDLYNDENPDLIEITNLKLIR